MPHGCSLSLHETNCRKSTWPMSSLLSRLGSISLTPPFPQLNMCDCETPSKTAGGVRQMSATRLQEPIAGRSLDFHPYFLMKLPSWTVPSDFHYIFTNSLCCLSAAPVMCLGVVRVHKSVLSAANCYPYEFQNTTSLDLDVSEQESHPISRNIYLIFAMGIKGNRSYWEASNLPVNMHLKLWLLLVVDVCLFSPKDVSVP